MRRTIAALAALVAASLAVAGTATGGAVQLKKLPIDVSFPLPDLSAYCGFEVDLVITGTANVTLITNADGVVVREMDTQPGSRFGFASPDTGKSFDFPNSLSLHTAYPDGAAPGAKAVWRLTGLIGNAPGVASDAGMAAGEGVVLFITPEGIPIIELTTWLVERGNRAEGVPDAICAALGA